MAGADQAGADGVTRIVEVGAKPETVREATAEAWLHTTPEALAHLVAGTKKGSPRTSLPRLATSTTRRSGRSDLEETADRQA